ncbi:MAG: Holliday junction resolvase RuvX [Bacteriovoracaceae bacterium]|nr:Holliday junction resolvase RuvX [Bacteriovoracaceae bacterium]
MNLKNFINYKKYLNKQILAIDYGTKVTGLATFRPGRDPYPLPFGKVIYEGDEQLIQKLAQLVDDESIDLVILGLPLLLDGKESDMTTRVREFGEALLKVLMGKNVALYFQDETLTTYEAKDRMKNSPNYNFKVDPKQIDALCAAIILEDFIKSLN